MKVTICISFHFPKYKEFLLGIGFFYLLSLGLKINPPSCIYYYLCCTYFSPKFPWLDFFNFFKILAFSDILISVRRPFRKTSTIPTYHGNSRKRIYLKDTTKNSIAIMRTSSVTNIEFSNSNYLILI